MEIKKQEGNNLIAPAFKFALIEYSKPYKISRGVKKRSYKLDSRYVPSKYHELHLRIIETRDQILAHADLRLCERNRKQAKAFGKVIKTRSKSDQDQN